MDAVGNVILNLKLLLLITLSEVFCVILNSEAVCTIYLRAGMLPNDHNINKKYHSPVHPP